MNVCEAISKRRSIRRFKSEPVTPAQITLCLEAARLAPSGTNCQPWKLLVVRDAGQQQRIAEAAFGQPMFTQAPVVIVLLGDTKAYRKRFRRGKELIEMGALAPEDVEKTAAAYKEVLPAEEDMTAIQTNCMLAGQNLVLAAVEQGLGSCWVGLFKKDRISEMFDLPKHLFPVALIPLGFPDQEPPPRPRYPLAEVAFDGSIAKPWADR